MVLLAELSAMALPLTLRPAAQCSLTRQITTTLQALNKTPLRTARCILFVVGAVSWLLSRSFIDERETFSPCGAQWASGGQKYFFTFLVTKWVGGCFRPGIGAL